MVTQLQPDVRAYLHGAEVIKRYIRVEAVAQEYGLSVEEALYGYHEWKLCPNTFPLQVMGCRRKGTYIICF